MANNINKVANTGSVYKGNVTIKIKKNNNIINVVKKHNSGMLTLSKAFAMFITGDKESINYRPQYLDLRLKDNYELPSESLSSWKPALKKTVSLSAPKFSYETHSYKQQGMDLWENNWVATLTATIPYDLLIYAVEADSTTAYRLFLMSEVLKKDPTSNRELAWVDISTEELSNLEPGTEAIIEWRLQLVHSMVETGE